MTAKGSCATCGHEHTKHVIEANCATVIGVVTGGHPDRCTCTHYVAPEPAPADDLDPAAIVVSGPYPPAFPVAFDDAPADDLDRLDALAAAATPGPWRTSIVPGEVWANRDPAGFDAFHVATTATRLNPANEADAAYIAAASPDVVRRLIADNRALNRRLYPGQGEGYANEVERQRYVIEELQRIARDRKARADAAEAEVERLRAAVPAFSFDGIEMNHRLEVAERDRDKARAEVERLLHIVEGMTREGVKWIAERDEARAALRAMAARCWMLRQVARESDTRLSEARAALADRDRRIDALTSALRSIQQWDCLNPPQRELLSDLPWLRTVVDTALGDES